MRHRGVATNLGLVCLALFFLVATVGRLHGSPTELVTLGAEAPSLAHPFGTDTLGRDVFDRTASAAWTSTVVSVGAVGLALLVAVPLGMWAGFRYGRRADGFVMRSIEVTQALPAFVLVIFLLGIMGSGAQRWGPLTVDPETRIAVCLAIAFVPFFARVARSATIGEMQLDYPTGLRALGVSRREIVFGELLPNVLPPLRVQALLAVGIAVFAEGGLSFLGLGVPPPQPTLGNLIADASPQVLDGTWWYALLPGIVLVVGILGCNLVGDTRERLMRDLNRRSFLRVGAAGALAVVGAPTVLTACASGDSGSRVLDRHRDGILRIGVAAAPSNINPLDSGSEVTRWIAEPVIETLYRYDEQLASVPLLADGEPEISGNALTWTLRLRDGITWHNGDPFVAADVVASLEHTLDLSAGSEWITYMIGYVQSFRALDDRTVEIRLARPYGLLRSHLTNLPIVHRDFVSRKDTMMGTGPYRLDGYEPGQSFAMSRYDDYHGEPGSFRGIEYTVFTDGTTRLVSLRQGKVDLITSVPAQSYDAARDADGVELVMADAPLDVLTYVNLTREPFSDRAFREAVAWSMDREGVLARVFGGEGTTGQGPIGPAELGWDPTLSVYPARPDIRRARSLLDQADTDRRSFTVTIGTSQTAKDIAQVLVAGWSDAGLDVTIEQLAGGPWSNKWLSLEYEMLMNTFQSGFTSGPANYLTLAPAHSKNVLTCGYHDDAVDAWIDEVWETSDEDAREAALQSITRRLARDAVIFPPVYAKLAVAQRTELSPLDPVQLRISRLSPQSLRFTD